MSFLKTRGSSAKRSTPLRRERVAQLRGRHPQAHVERAKKGIHGAHFVEAHLVDEFLEDQGILGEKVDAPTPRACRPTPRPSPAGPRRTCQKGHTRRSLRRSASRR